MTLKKMFTALTGGLVALSYTVVPAAFGATTYSEELQGAYDYAYEAGVTTMTSIDNANMYGNLTRGQLAKMVANWAETELGLEADTSLACDFSDANTAEGDLAIYLKKACQMGLMGVGITAFRPNDNVTRGEFGTTLSRAIWGDQYNTTETPYYKNHLAALKDAGIMSNVSNPDALEMRGWTMLMLQRAGENLDGLEESAECRDPLVMLACALDLDSCPAACKAESNETVDDTIIKSGDLSLTVTTNDGANAIVGGPADLDHLTFKASERLTLNKVTLERYGYSSRDDVANVWLENENGEVVTNEKGLNSKDVVELTLKRDFRDLKEGNFVIVVEIASGVTAGGTIGFKVTDVTSSAKNITIGKYSPATYKIIEYTGSSVALSEKGQNRSYYYTPSELYEVARLQVKPASAIAVNGFTLTNNGTLDLKRYISDVEVLRDSTALKNVTYSINGDELRVNFAKDTIEAKKNALYVVKVKLEGLDRFNETIKFELKNTSDFGAVELKTNARVTPAGIPVDFYTYTFNGDKVTLTNGNLASTVYGAAGSENVVVAEGTVALKEAVKLNNFDIVASATGLDSLTISVAGDEYDVTPAADGKTFTFKNVYIEKAGTIKFLADVSDEAVGQISFTTPSFAKVVLVNGSGYVGKYDEYNEWIDGSNFVGSIKFSTLRVEAAKGSLTNDLSKEQEIKESDTTRLVLFDGNYSAKREDVSLNELVIKKILGTGLTTNDLITFYLSIDGSEVASIDIDSLSPAGGVSELFDDVEVKDGKSVKVKLEADVYLDQLNTYQFELTLKGQNNDGNDAGVATDSTVKVKVVTGGSVIVTEKAKVHYKDTVVKSDTNIELASFIIKAAENSAISDLTELTFVVPNTVGTGELKIKVDGSDETDNLSFVTTGSTYIVTLDGINFDLTDDVEVIITHRAQLTASATPYTLNLTHVNGTPKARAYSRLVVPALVSIQSQSNTDDETTFVINVDKETGDEITNLELYVDVSGTPTKIGEKPSVENGDTIEVANGDNVQYISQIKYTVGSTITITKVLYNDYFRVGETYAKIAKSK